MKMSMIVSVLVAMSASLAIASDGFGPTDLVTATQSSLDAFSAANPDHVVHVAGFKTWKSGTEAKVKIYVAHDGMNMEYNYGCAKHGDEIHCSKI